MSTIANVDKTGRYASIIPAAQGLGQIWIQYCRFPAGFKSWLRCSIYFGGCKWDSGSIDLRLYAYAFSKEHSQFS
jgi:hypothetical protein